MSFLKNTAYVLSTTIVVSGLRLLIIVSLARLLTTDDMGRFAVTIAFATMAMLMSQMGLASSAVYRIRRLAEPRAEVAGSTLVTATMIGIAGALALVALEPLVGTNIFKGEPGYRIGIALASCQLLGAVFTGVARGIDRFGLANRYRLFGSALQLVGLWIVLGAMDGALVEALTVTVLAEAAAASYLVVSVLRVTGFSLASWRARLGPTLRYGLKSHAQAMAGNLHEQLDVFMLAYLLYDTTPIAIYSVAVGVTSRLKLIPDAIASALFPEVAGLTRARAAEFASKAARHSFAGVVLMALTVAVASPIVVPLAFGEIYGASVPTLWILLPGMALLTNFMLFGRYFMAIDRQQVPVASQCLSLAVNVVLNVILIPHYEIHGAAFASLASYSVEFALITLFFVRSTGTPLRSTTLLKRDDVDRLANRLRRWRGTSVVNQQTPDP
jgi:O-antigen/teichoic acid export membrane protein